ncbi:MAG: carboxypeptidase-like regulatory domain-containing protein [Draconibacterium sp.]|jgi:hypothetical protein
MKAGNYYVLILPFTVLFTLIAAAVEAKSVDIANPGKITGRIHHENTTLPLEFVNVALYSATDSTLFAGTLTNQFGEFTFSMLDSGSYYIEITLPGYQKQQLGTLAVSTCGNKINLGEISLMSAVLLHPANRIARGKNTKHTKTKPASEIPEFNDENEAVLVDNRMNTTDRIRK